MRYRALVAGLAVAATLTSVVLAVPSSADVAAPTVVAPVGFTATVFAPAGGLPTALTVGPDGRVFATVTDMSGGWVTAWDDLGAGVAGPGEQVADGLQLPMGLVFGSDGTLYVSENSSLDGPDARGRITALRDTDSDGVFEDHQTVVANIPNGRHQTNGLTFGPDGWLYIANGSATDDGLECGPVGSTECVNPEIQPWTGSILRVDPVWRDVDLMADADPAQVLAAEGLRNSYGLAFRPGTSSLYTVMNGPDDPSGSEPIYRTDVADAAIDDMGFPSCLYDPHDNRFPEPQIGGHDHPGEFTPSNNPNRNVIDAFGPCPVASVTKPIGFASGHAGATGLRFVPAGPFADHTGDLLYAESGSIWNLNSGQPNGHELFVHDVNPDGTLGERLEFMTLPMPMDVAFDNEGVLFVADLTGAIYRVAASG